MKKRIALYGKGGIGKTTVAVNTALCMARRGYRVLLVGCDPKQSVVLRSRRPETGRWMRGAGHRDRPERARKSRLV